MDLNLAGREKKKKVVFPLFLHLFTQIVKTVLFIWMTLRWKKIYNLFLLKSRERYKGLQRLQQNRKAKVKHQNLGLDAITVFLSNATENKVLWKKISK